jgi:hypothetical protein
MDKFSIVDLCGNNKDIPYLVKELRQNNFITATERDIDGEPVYITHNLVGVKRVAQDYDGLTIDVHK